MNQDSEEINSSLYEGLSYFLIFKGEFNCKAKAITTEQ